MVETIRFTIGGSPDNNERKTRRLFSRNEERRGERVAAPALPLSDETYAPDQELLKAEKADLLILAGITVSMLAASVGLLLF